LDAIMIPETVPPITGFFNTIKDPRIDRRKYYPLIEVIVITLLAAMAFAKGRADIERVSVHNVSTLWTDSNYTEKAGKEV
jgi:hypothetical protein